MKRKVVPVFTAITSTSMMRCLPEVLGLIFTFSVEAFALTSAIFEKTLKTPVFSATFLSESFGLPAMFHEAV